MGKSCSTSLAPGFRFHPTDEELVWYYLRRKVNGKSFRLDAISEIDIYKVEPYDLPGLSKLKTRDLEWYFFSALDRKYGNGSRTNRATNEGYWKTTGKDRPVYHKSQVVGMKKTLVYHKGRAPRGERSNWVMHEYKLSDEVLEKAVFPDGFVLCRVFQKSGTGPKNGEQYGAPLVEEEWEDDNSGVVEPTQVSFEDPYDDDEVYIEQIDLDQAIDIGLPENVPFSNPVGSNNSFVDFQDMTVTDQSCVVQESDDKFSPSDLVSQKFPELVQDDENNACVVTNEHMIQPNDTSNEAPVDLPDVFFDSIDFLQSVEDHADTGFESYLDDDLFWKSFLIDPPCELGSQGLANDDIHSIWQTPYAGQPLPGTSDDGISMSSKQVMEVTKAEPSKNDIEHSWLSQANSLLDNIPAPPAFASEFPSKHVVARVHAAVQSSTSTNVTAGMIRIRDMPTRFGESGLQLSFDKTGNVNVLLSFDLPQVVNPAGPESLTGLLSSKMSFWLMFFLVFVFGLSAKFLTCIYAK